MKSYALNMAKNHIIKTVILLLCCFKVQTSIAQNNILDNKISIQFTNESLADALTKIENQVDCIFSYTPTSIKIKNSINKNYIDTSLRDILSDILIKHTIYYHIRGNTIFMQTDAEKGEVSGKILTENNTPAAFVSVLLQGTIFGTSTDENGLYSFYAPQGEYRLLTSFIGLKEHKQNISIVANVNTIINFTLEETAEGLQEVIVNGDYKREYAIKKTEQVARMPLENLENPQVYSVISAEILEQQLITSFDDALKSAAGVVSGGASPGIRSYSYLRGFGQQAFYRDGKMLGNWTENDMANIERIEVIKGPSGTLFGGHSRSNYGGVINRVTKKPFDSFGGQVSLISGSNAYNRFSLDINAPVNEEKTVLARLNTSYRKEGSFQDFGWAESVFVAPVVSYKVSDQLSFVIEADYFKIKGAGIGWLTIDKDISSLDEIIDLYKLSFTTDELVYSKQSNMFVATALYKINDHWSSTTSYAYSHSDYDNKATDTEIVNDTLAYRGLISSIYDIDFTSIQQNFNGDFKIGKMRNRMLVGFDYLKDDEIYSGVWADYDSFNYNEKAPYFSAENAADTFGENSSWTGGVTKERYGIYVSDVLDATRSLHIMLSLRYDYAVHKRPHATISNAIDKESSYNQGSWIPKLGIVYEIIPKQVSVFGNYMKGIDNVNTIQINNGTAEGELVSADPEKATQWEVGIKTNLFDDKLTFMASYFDIEVDNIVRTDPSDAQFELQDGTQRNKGIELELFAQPILGLDIMLGYAHLDAEYLNGSQKGNRPDYTPDESLNAWINYALTQGKYRGLGLGFGGNYRSDSYLTSDNEIINPGVLITNASLFYDQPSYRFTLKINNLNNQMDWGDGYTPQALRTLKASLIFKF